MVRLDWESVLRPPRRKVALLLVALFSFIFSAMTTGAVSTAFIFLGTLCVLGALILLARTYGLTRE